MSASTYPRDLIGYGRTPPHARWPGNARIAVQFVINYEEGGENCILHGDAGSEAFLSEIVGATSWPGQRHMNMESIYEYGSRAGYWRLWRMFTGRLLPVTVFGVATAMARHPDIVASMNEAGWEVATHGLKWIEYKDFSRADEESAIHQAVQLHTVIAGKRPLGFYQGRCSANTTEIVMAEQGFLYSADSYADDLPYWVQGPHGHQLIVPYTLDANDMRFATPQGFNAGDQFFAYLKDTFDTLYAEGATAPKMMSVGLHCRLAGRPGRAAALARFLDYVQAHDQVWVATRLDIARHWIKTHPPEGGYKVSEMPRALLTERLAVVFEHSPWVAARAADAGSFSDIDTLHQAMMRCVHSASTGEQLALIRAHPELAGQEASANNLTVESSGEQGRLGFTSLSRTELDLMSEINRRYRETFGFPCIVALALHTTRSTVIAEMQSRLSSTQAVEHAKALEQIGHIVRGRLAKIFAGQRNQA